MSINKRVLFRIGVVVLATLAVFVGVLKTPNQVSAATPGAIPPANPTCYPSCQANDGRFFSLAGSGLITFAGGSTTIGLRVNGAANPATFKVGIFDGDAGGLWDQDTALTGEPLVFELFGDSNNDGTADTGVLDTLPVLSMVDNGWAYFTVNSFATARLGGAGTDYVYLLKVSLQNPGNIMGLVQNNFKVAADSAVTQLFITPQIISFQAFQNDIAEFNIIHPGGQVHCNPGEALPCAPSNYDGKWNFSFFVDPTDTAINVWDGDFDIGSVFAPVPSVLDTDDNTPNVKPDDGSISALGFSLGGAMGILPEGIGTTTTCVASQPAQGCPPDDSVLPSFRRTTVIPGDGIVVRLIPPVGAPFVNGNPSGTNEWELTRVAVSAGDPFPVFTDFPVATLDLVPGPAPELWTYQIEGMDLGNLFALRFNKRLIVEPFKVGDTVFCDANTNGTQDQGDVGVAGVTVELLNTLNQVVKTTTTNASGVYNFQVVPGSWTVRIAASNFAVGGALEGKTSTSGGNQQTKAVVNADVLTFDFGYNCSPPRNGTGCSPGYWKQSQHFGSYPPGVTPNTLFLTIFGEDAFPGKTLLQVLSTGGGGLTALGRIIVGAYLNAATVNTFPSTPAQVVADFNAVFPGGNYETLKSKYEAYQGSVSV